jgi:SWI/SNF-related matrix-associated actin-dependent regulator of chromatin subfamily A member 5
MFPLRISLTHRVLLFSSHQYMQTRAQTRTQGKTLQTISLLCHLKENEKITGPSLIVCPLSVLSSWCNEMRKWAPSLKFIQMHASNQEEQLRQRKHLLEHATEYDVILTTYDMAKAPAFLFFFQRTRFHYLVLDEGHKIKSHVTLVSRAMRKIHSGNRLLLTGTPLQNNLVELWSLMNFLYPEIFTICDPFEAHFDLKENIIDKAFLGKTQKLLELFMLRRLKQEVEKLIPEKLETKVYCPLSKVQTFWYKALLMKDVNRLAKLDSSTEGIETNIANSKLLRSLFMQLRKCSNHPFLFDGAETNPDETSLEDLIGASGKLSVLDMLLRSLFQKGHRAVLFSQFTMLLDLIEDYCILRGWKYCRLDGQTPRARRNYLVNRFSEPNSEHFLFLMSTRSGGMGLNLQTADTCILFDSDWNPQSDIQAMARVHRIGQKKTVHVYRLITAGTIEERMLERAEKKLLLEMVNRDSHSNTTMDPEQQDPDEVARGFSAGELWEDIKFGCEAVFGNSSNNELPSEEDIAAITNRARKESDSVGKLTGGTILDAKFFDASKEFTSSQLFRGVNFLEIRKQQQLEKRKDIPDNLKGIAYLWYDIKALENKKRVRKSRICQIEGKGTGYGLSHVPVLAANNYTFGGETSVFDRELKESKKSNFEVKKREKGPRYEHTDHCVICGDGGSLVCCDRCPNTVHLTCVGLKNPKDFHSCPHHRCSICTKNRTNAGGLLFLCHACPTSFCEECLPKEGITFLDKFERFEKLGFDSTKHNVYINCSDRCEMYAIQEYGYRPPNPNQKKKFVSCPEVIDLSGHFGTSYDLDEAAAAVETEKEASSGRGKRKVARKNYSLGIASRKNSDIAFAATVTPAKSCCLGATSNPNHSVTTTPKQTQLQLTKSSKSNDTPSTSATSATDASSEASSYCIEVDYIAPIPASSGNDANHAIRID